MALLRSLLLACSHNRWLREEAPRYQFVRRTVSRFMPGERAEDALAAARELEQHSIGAVFTHLGENVTDREEALAVASEYLGVLDLADSLSPAAEISVKLTHLGIDFDPEVCFASLEKLVQRAAPQSCVWIDMESSGYVNRTIYLYRRARARYRNVGVCLQAYLYRTAGDLDLLLELGPAIRLVKGAYNEPGDRAFGRKAAVDENYFKLSQKLLSAEARASGVRAAFATHDRRLIRRIIEHAQSVQAGRSSLEFQMLYGIQRAEQLRLAREGWRTRVLISYGSAWFPWFMRRLAERPANVMFVLKNLFGG
ncbi:MAG: proline dehydrogenase family protein [Terriglobia bacterium]